jgi:hypothetical protein
MFSISPLLKTESGSCRFELHWYDIPASSPTPPARNSQWPQDIRSSPHPLLHRAARMPSPLLLPAACAYQRSACMSSNNSVASSPVLVRSARARPRYVRSRPHTGQSRSSRSCPTYNTGHFVISHDCPVYNTGQLKSINICLGLQAGHLLNMRVFNRRSQL